MRLTSILALLALTACATTPPATGEFQQVRRTCRQWVATGKVRSIAVAIARNGKIVFEEAYGYQDAEAKREATVDTMYTLASTGKSITGTVFQELAHHNEIDLDAPVTRYLPRDELTVYEGNPAQVTVRAMLSMGVAVPHLWWHHWEDQRNIRLTRAELARRYAIVVAPPDGGFYYSNLTYGLLAETAANATRTDFASLVAQTVFEPLGMTHSSLRPEPRFAPWLAAAYGSDGTRRPYAYSDPEGAAGYRASIHDLMLYSLAQLGYVPNFRYLRQTHDAREGYFAGWGHLKDAGGLRFAISNGGIVGGSSEIKLVPEDNLAVACLSNTTGAPVGEIVDAAIGAVDGRYQGKIATALPKEEPFSATVADTGHWTGEVKTWEAIIPIAMDVTPDGGVSLLIGTSAPQPLTRVRIDAGFVRGECGCSIPLSDTEGEPTKADFALRRAGDRWFGSVRVISTGPRSSFSLPAFVTLTRTTPPR